MRSCDIWDGADDWLRLPKILTGDGAGCCDSPPNMLLGSFAGDCSLFANKDAEDVAEGVATLFKLANRFGVCDCGVLVPKRFPVLAGAGLVVGKKFVCAGWDFANMFVGASVEATAGPELGAWLVV